MENVLNIKKSTKKTGCFANVEEVVKFQNAELVEIFKKAGLIKIKV
jgi:hypothetical protein